MPAVRHRRPEEGRMRLALLSDVQNRNLLGYEAGPLGTQREFPHSDGARSSTSEPASLPCQ